MTCRELVEFLSAHLDGELPPDVRQDFDAHLAACPECAAYVEAYRVTVRLAKAAFMDLDDPVPPEVPAELLAAILDRGGGRA